MPYEISFTKRVPIVGALQLMGQTHVQGIRGHRYRVYYSPASKAILKLEALRY